MRPHPATTVLTAVIIAATTHLVFAPTGAAAEEASTGAFGEPLNLADGATAQAWTVDGLRQSSDDIAYPIQGTLWEATATDTATEGSALPIIPNFNARSRDGHLYRVLFQVASAGGISPARLDQGQTSTGKIYFDVTGDTPDAVVYDAGAVDLLTWTPPPTSPSTGTPPAPRTPSSPSNESVPATPPPSLDAAPPATGDAPPPPTGWQGTPLPPRVSAQSQPPPPATRQGTALTPSGAEGVQTPTPADAPVAGTAPEPRWQGTPLPTNTPTADGRPTS